MTALPPILAFAFVTPWLAGLGAACVSIPIIIHLLNKRKFRTVLWAAMDFLLAAQRRNSRRLKFQRWLLLALRCLALLALAAGVAQLIPNRATLANFFGVQRTTIVIWDDSYSMGYLRTDNATTFDRSKKALTAWLAKIPASDKVMIIRASRGGIVESNKPTLDHTSLISQVNAATVTDASTDLAKTLTQAAARLSDAEQSSGERDLIILTDLSRGSIYGSADSGAAESLKKAMEAAKAHATSVRILDAGTAEQSNLALTDLHTTRPVVVAGNSAQTEITLFNAADRPQTDVPLTILVDGVEADHTRVTVDAGASRTVAMNVNLQTPGRHLLTARIDQPDQLPIDNTRYLMVDAQREVPILLVDGSPGDNGLTSRESTMYLSVAYALPVGGKSSTTAFTTKFITELELPTVPLANYAIVILSDTAEPAPALRENLKHYVENGGLLMFFPGPRTNPAVINAALGDAGAKLLPATFGEPLKADLLDASAAGIPFAQDFKHPVLARYATASGNEKMAFTNVRTTQYFKLNIPADEGVESILRYAQRDGTPGDAAVVMKNVGKGKVIQFASTADRRWNDWGGHSSFLVFINELTYYALPRQGEGLTLRLGDKIDLPADAATPGLWSAPRREQISVSSTVQDGRARLISGPLNLAGSYAPVGSAEGRPVVAVNVDPQEADIRHVNAAPFADALGISAKDISTQITPDAWLTTVETPADPAGASYGPMFVGIALFFFALEALLAMFFSSYR